GRASSSRRSVWVNRARDATTVADVPVAVRLRARRTSFVAGNPARVATYERSRRYTRPPGWRARNSDAVESTTEAGHGVGARRAIAALPDSSGGCGPGVARVISRAGRPMATARATKCAEPFGQAPHARATAPAGTC